MIKTNIIGLFPTAVLGTKLDREFTKTELEFFKQVQTDTRKNAGNSASNDNYILDSKELASLKSFFESQLMVYRDTVLRPKNDMTIYITQSWLNYSEPGDYHHRHNHPNSYVSGVFYIETNSYDGICFDRGYGDQLEVTPVEFNSWNSNTWKLPATPYQLYLFPSRLTHSVEKVVGTKTRISLAFNTFVSGVIGDRINLTEIKL
jgi:uncharacterized protein (TIGR02466 family)